MSSTTPSQPSSKYVDYDEFVDYQLEKTRGEIKWNDVLTTLAGIAALTLAYLFVFTLFDHWVIEGGFSRGTRAVLLTLLVVVSLGWTVWKIVLPWWRKVHLLFAARMIEEHVPGLRSNLLNLIDLEAAGRKPHPGIQQAMEKRSAVELSRVDMEHVIDRRQLLRICYVLLAVVVLFCLYALFSPKPISFLRPLTVANIPVATQTRIVEVTPGDASVLARRSLPVSVIVRDKKPEQVLFHYTTEDQSFVDEQLEMQANEEKEGEYLLLFAGENGDGIGQRTTYYITAGDARSETFTIDVEKVPTAVIDRIEYRYPEYMDFEPRSQVIGAIDAWEGTEVVLEARIGNNVPVKTAVVQFVDPNQTAAGYEEVPLTVIDGNRLRGAWKLQFREDGTYTREYRIVCKSEEGLSEDDPPTYPITIRPDEAPEVGFVDPTGDIERAANAVVPLVYKARDPDFQLRYITLRVEKGGEELQSYQLFDGEQKAVADRYRWELKPLGLKPGDVVTFALEARDNKQPFGNRRTSQPLKLTITTPVEPEEVEQQLQQDEAEQEPRLEDEQQAAAEENGEQGGASESEESGEEGDENSEEDAGGSDREKSQEGENEGASDKERMNENSGENEKQTGEQPDADNENADDKPQPTDDGMGEESEKPEVGEEAGEEGGEPNALKNDGIDDAEVLEKIIEEQQENSNQAPGDNENADQQNNNAEGTGNESPTNEASDDPSQQGTGNGTQKQDDQNSDAQNNSDNNSENSNEGEPGEPSDGPADQKRPGDPDTKGTGTPDEKTDPKDATKASDPNNIDRKEGTQPKTTPSSDPRDPDAPQEQTDQPPKNPSNAGEEKGDPNSPGPKTQPEGPDRPEPAEGDPKGQRSKKPDSGETGSSQQTSDGKQGGSEPGNGETTDNPGDSAEGEGGKESKGGEPGDPKSSQKESGEGKAGGKESSGGEGEGEGSAEGGSGKGDKPSTGELGEGSGTGTGQAPGTSGGGGAGQEGNAPGPGEGSASSSAEEQNLEHAKEAADLVLKRLEQQLERGEVSEDLLKELGWTEGEMKSFVDRMRQQLSQNRDELTSEEAVRQRQFEEMLKNMNFRPKKEAARTNDSRPGKATRSFSGRDLPVPIEYRDAYEAFTRDLGRKK
ncbi:MAG: hypothetical protein HUJ26_09690 [Planctomycetaceae bacterium]|nr:hypothetical protein [Planctomycetaceae bacterium]